MNFLDNLMAPLGREHCMVYYYLGLFTLFFAVLAVVNGLLNVINKKSRDKRVLLLLISLTLFFMYYLYRITYSICSKSL